MNSEQRGSRKRRNPANQARTAMAQQHDPDMQNRVSTIEQEMTLLVNRDMSHQVCQLCGVFGHTAVGCLNMNIPTPAYEDVNYVGGYGNRQKNFNPAWRNPGPSNHMQEGYQPRPLQFNLLLLNLLPLLNQFKTLNSERCSSSGGWFKNSSGIQSSFDSQSWEANESISHLPFQPGKGSAKFCWEEPERGS